MAIISFVVYDDVKSEANAVSYEGNLKMRDFLTDYVKKYTEFETLDTKIYVFKSGTKILNAKKYLDDQIETYIQNGARITFTRKMGLHYSNAIKNLKM
jgi:hypothetical protein